MSVLDSSRERNPANPEESPVASQKTKGILTTVAVSAITVLVLTKSGVVKR